MKASSEEEIGLYQKLLQHKDDGSFQSLEEQLE